MNAFNCLLFLVTIFMAINCLSAANLNSTSLNATFSNATFSNATSSNATDVEIKEVHRFNVTEYHKIQIAGNPADVFKNKSYALKVNFRVEHKLPSSLIFETDNSFYFVTRVDHKANLTVNFNYRVSPKKLLVIRYEYQVNAHENLNETFNSELEVEFKNLDFKTYLTKETAILDYFNRLGNGAVVSGIFDKKKNLRVILANLDSFSYKTKLLAKPENCKDVTKIADLDVVPCSIVIRSLDNVNKSNYTKNEVNLDFDFVKMGNSGLTVTLNYFLAATAAAIIFFQGRFLLNH